MKSDKIGSTGISKTQIICDGDSWVFGCEIVDPVVSNRYPKTTHPGAYDYTIENDSYRIPKIFPTHLAGLLDVEVINLSWPADDNGSILNRTIDYITNNYISKNISTDDLFVIIGWSSPERTAFWYKDGIRSMPFRLWPQVPHFDTPMQEDIWKLYVTYLWNEEEYIPRYVRNVVYLQNFCKAHNIKWMCFNSFYQTPKQSIEGWTDMDVMLELEKIKHKCAGYQTQSSDHGIKRFNNMNDCKALWNTIDPIRFYKKDQPNNTFKSYIESKDRNISPVFNGWHPSPESHAAWAEELARYISINNLL
jgi:hypothetical protein